MRDLILLVPDKNTEYSIRGALSRPMALGIRPVDFQILVEQGRDGGVRSRGAQLLATQRSRFSRAVLLLDYEGCGTDSPPDELESRLDAELSRTWGGRAKAIVVDPEIDIWMWGADTHLRAVLGWSFSEDIRSWLASQSFVFRPDGKPVRPKEALEAACRRAATRRSSGLYEQIVGRISFARCTDLAFLRLRSSIGDWFGGDNA